MYSGLQFIGNSNNKNGCVLQKASLSQALKKACQDMPGSSPLEDENDV